METYSSADVVSWTAHLELSTSININLVHVFETRRIKHYCNYINLPVRSNGRVWIWYLVWHLFSSVGVKLLDRSLNVVVGRRFLVMKGVALSVCFGMLKMMTHSCLCPLILRIWTLRVVCILLPS